MLKKIVTPLYCLILLFACQKNDPELAHLQLKLIGLNGHLPISSYVSNEWPLGLFHNVGEIQRGSLLSHGSINYLYGAGDSVTLTILEFNDDMAALGFQLNSGLVRENLPIVKGDYIERSIRAGRRIFLFRSGIYRPIPAGVADQFVKSFPGYKAGLPNEYFALPIKNRLPNGASLQMGSFAGTSTDFPMLIQRYGDPSGVWQCARSWSQVSQEKWHDYTKRLSKNGVFKQVDIGNVLCSNDGCMWLDRLDDGRIIAVYGDVDLERLTHYYMQARESLVGNDS